MILEHEFSETKSVFNQDELNSIISLGEVDMEDATIEANKIKEHRSSSISWLKRDDTTEFIYSKVLQLIYMENVNNKWNFDYDAIEDLQFTRYDKSQHYNWHADQTSTAYQFVDEELSGKIRKISFSIILNDDFEGGDFQFEVGAPHEEDRIITLTPSKGCAIVFPSFKFHRVTPVTKGVRYSLVGWICGKPFV